MYLTRREFLKTSVLEALALGTGTFNLAYAEDDIKKYLFQGDELQGIALADNQEVRTQWGGNPVIRDTNTELGGIKEMWAAYLMQERNNSIIIRVDKFKTKQLAKEKAEWMKQTIHQLLGKEKNTRIYCQDKYTILVGCRDFASKEQERQHKKRLYNYEERRGLNLIFSDF